MKPATRTTVTLDPDVAKEIKELARRRKTPFNATLNDVLRRGLSPRFSEEGPEPFTVHAHKGGFRPAIDPGKLNQLVDELEVAERVRKMSKDG